MITILLNSTQSKQQNASKWTQLTGSVIKLLIWLPCLTVHICVFISPAIKTLNCRKLVLIAFCAKCTISNLGDADLHIEQISATEKKRNCSDSCGLENVI